MDSGSKTLVIAAAILAYVAFIGGIIWLAIRWGKKQMAQRAQAMAAGLEGVGGRLVNVAPDKGPYQGAEREYDIGGRRVFSNSYSVSRYYYRANLRIDAGPQPWVTIIPEGKVDRLGKALGLNHEVQTGDKGFDDAAYIDTVEADAPVQRVLESGAVREGIQKLLALGFQVQLSEKGVEAFQLLQHSTPPDVTRLGEAAALLGRVADALPRLDRASFKGKASTNVAAVVLLLSFLPAILVAGLIEATLQWPGDRTLHASGDKLTVLLGALGLWTLYVGALIVVMRGRSEAFRVLLVGALVGLLCYPMLGALGTFALNQGLDDSPADERTVVVSNTSRHKADCRIQFNSWTLPGRTDKVRLDCKHQNRLRAGAEVKLRAHKGALGIPWVEPIDPP